ncbi:Uma2 family endonuclease [Chloracidobacterium sp. MS 40/45]|nr:Uma2 family endonuclease [Chloracidobacterium sp. MS 40/45]
MTSPVEAVSVEAGPVEAVGQALDFTEDFTRELPCEDGIPLENLWHRLQINLLDDCVHQLWRGRTDFYAGGNMFVYYSLQQVQRQDYKGPDFFVVKDVDGSYVRPCWVAWREGGRLPDVIVELLSPSTRGVDLGAKKALYEQVFRTREYFCYGPDPTQGGEPELLGWVLGRDGYEALAADERGWLWSRVFGAWVGEWEGEYHGARSRWLRLYDAEGRLIPTAAEAAQAEAERARTEAETERKRAEAAQAEAEAERKRAEAAEARAAALEAELARVQARLSNQPETPSQA